MTEKLYYQDSYLSEFEAKVLSCAQKGNKYEVVLSGTAFFPEGGGQTADTGILSEGEKTVQVLDVQEKEGILVHETDGPCCPTSLPGSGESIPYCWRSSLP